MSCGQGTEGSSRVKGEDGRWSDARALTGGRSLRSTGPSPAQGHILSCIGESLRTPAILQDLRGNAHVSCAFIDCSFVLLSTPSRRPVTARSPHSEQAVEGSAGSAQPTQVSVTDVGSRTNSISCANHPSWLPPPHAVDLAGISVPPRFVSKCQGTAVVRVLCCCAEMDSSGVCSPS